MLKRMPITPSGYQKMQEELSRLLKVDRPKNIRDIAEARAHGDLSENAEYHAAKERQSFLEGRIQELEHLLNNAVIIDLTELSTDIIQVGSCVTVQEGDYPAETYWLVGAKEADPRNGKISNESPIGRVLLGSHVGDEVIASTPGGEIKLKILKIE